METEKRRIVRRKSDQMLMETLRFHRAILDLLQGKAGDFQGALSRIQLCSSGLGRRESDRRLGEEFRKNLEEIADRLVELGVIERLPRKIRLRKVLGKTQGKFPLGLERVGWEMEPPKVGHRYCLYLDDGRIFRTGVVMEASPDHFRTGNSVYSLEVMESQSLSNSSGDPVPSD